MGLAKIYHGPDGTSQPSDQEPPSKLLLNIQEKILLERRPGENVFSAMFDFSDALAQTQIQEAEASDETGLGDEDERKTGKRLPDVIDDVKESMEYRII